MNKLPITKKEYENAVLFADFTGKTKKAFLKNNITDFCFVPQVNGYEISYKKNGENIVISIKFRRVFRGIKIQTTRQIHKKCFCSKSSDENTAVCEMII